MIDDVPQPPLLAFAAHTAPHFIHLDFVSLPQDDVHLRRIKGAEQPSIHLLDGRRFFWHVDDRGRTDSQDTDDIPHTTPIERHVDNLLLHRGQTPLALVLYEENGARTRTIVTAIALRPMGLLPELHHIDTVTLGTLPVDKCHTPFPSS